MPLWRRGAARRSTAYDDELRHGHVGCLDRRHLFVTDANITTSDTLLTTVASPALAVTGAAGYYDVQNLSVTLPGNLAPGTYYIGGIADYTNAVSESNEGNNTYNTVAITVTAPAKPDLSEYVAVGKTTLAAGASTAITTYDINLGRARRLPRPPPSICPPTPTSPPPTRCSRPWPRPLWR